MRLSFFLPLLVLALGISYAPGLDAPSVHDDLRSVLQNPDAAEPVSILPRLLSPPPPNRRLSDLSVSLQRVSGQGARSLRMGNLILHTGACILVFLLAESLAGSGSGPWASLFFALHPIGVEAVTYLSQRPAVLETLLSFLSLLGYSRGRRGAALLACGLAFLSKETALTLPLSLLALECFLRKSGESWKEALRRWSPCALLAGGLLAWRMGTQNGGLLPSDPYILGSWGYFLAQLGILGRYAALALWPFPLRFRFDRVLPGGATVLCALLLLTGLAWILKGPRAHRLPRLALAFFMAPLALESSFLPIHDLAFHHRVYPSLLGGALLFGALAHRRLLGRTLGCLTLGLFALGSSSENHVWRTPDLLLRRDVRHAFHVDVAWADHAWKRLEQGSPARAERLFHRALASPWKEMRTRLGHAAALASLPGRKEEAWKELEGILRDFPQEGDPLWLGLRLAGQEGDLALRRALVSRALALPRDRLRPELAAWLEPFR